MNCLVVGARACDGDGAEIPEKIRRKRVNVRSATPLHGRLHKTSLRSQEANLLIDKAVIYSAYCLGLNL
jgi:hypothetical protein